MNEDVKCIYLLMLGKDDKIYRGDGLKFITRYCQSCIDIVVKDKTKHGR